MKEKESIQHYYYSFIDLERRKKIYLALYNIDRRIYMLNILRVVLHCYRKRIADL